MRLTTKVEKDRWGNSIYSAVRFDPSDTSILEERTFAEYYLGGQYKYFSGNIIRGAGLYDSEIVWLQIYADEVLIYESKKMDYKNQGISFDIPINNAKYIKIVAISDSSNSTERHFFVANESNDLYITDGKLYN